jgi:hypothetical protein
MRRTRFFTKEKFFAKSLLPIQSLSSISSLEQSLQIPRVEKVFFLGSKQPLLLLN